MSGKPYLLQCHLLAESEGQRLIQEGRNRRNLRALFLLSVVCLLGVLYQSLLSTTSSSLRTSTLHRATAKRTPIQTLLEREIDCIETGSHILSGRHQIGTFVPLKKRQGIANAPHPTLRAKYVSRSLDFGYTRHLLEVQAINAKRSGWTRVATLTCPKLCPPGSPHPCILPQPEVSQ